jgi:hypothetical protein
MLGKFFNRSEGSVRMTLERKIKQYGVLVVGLLIGGGFAFGGIASYAGLVDSGNSNRNGETFDATLPTDNYRESTFGLSLREQQVLAAQNDVVFVNLMYSSENNVDLSGFPSTMAGRAYVEVANETEVPYDNQYGVTDFPAAVVVGSRRNARVQLVRNVTQSNIASAACNGFSSWSTARGSVVGQCQR